MKRRAFITLLGGAAAWPLDAAQGQQAQMPVVGLLRSSPAVSAFHLVVALRQGLNEAGFVEGQNVVIEQRWADNQLDRLSGLAADLVRHRAAVIVCNGVAVEAAKGATASIPIVFVVGDDPVKMGLVASLNRPDRNLTGVTFFGGGRLGAKRLELLRELVPRAGIVAILLDPGPTGIEVELSSLETAGRALGIQTIIVRATTEERELDTAFAQIVAAGASAILLGGGPFLSVNRERIVRLAAHYALPTVYELRDYVEAGGLLSYSASFPGAYRQAGVYAGRILKGAKPIDLPVVQPTTFELAINLRTAKTLGLAVPPSLLARADEVIE